MAIVGTSQVIVEARGWAEDVTSRDESEALGWPHHFQGGIGFLRLEHGR